MKYLRYLWYVLRHKWFVFLACWKLFQATRETPMLWRGIFHDASKFYPSEFGPYARHFYGKKNPPGGYSKYTDRDDDPDFDAAWEKHWKRNDHHWEHWRLRTRNGGRSVIHMPQLSWLEMACDWWGAGRAQLGDKHRGWKSTLEWYRDHDDTIELHSDTRRDIEAFLRDKAKETT
jgi:hypothetical protein